MEGKFLLCCHKLLGERGNLGSLCKRREIFVQGMLEHWREAKGDTQNLRH